MTLVQIVRIPSEGVAAFQAFESRVLPLMKQFGGVLERRLRSADGQTEIHVLSFPSTEALDAYRNSEQRGEHLPLLEHSGALSQLIEVTDVEM
jgi:hypothetical protein